MQRRGFSFGSCVALAAFALLSNATVLRQLSLSEMSQKSTEIVRARVLESGGVLRGSDVYTVYRVAVGEVWKTSPNKAPIRREAAEAAKEIAVAIPGGIAGGLRQYVAGAPTLKPGGEYVLFLWTGKSGLTQVIGLSQGVFQVGSEPSDPRVQRSAAKERMVDARGQAVNDQDESMRVSALRRIVRDSIAARQEAR